MLLDDYEKLTPKKIVEELDKYVVGQREAKRMVAIALRSRWRRQQLPADLKDEVYPKNIIMIGPTGVGKTEISRRLAKLAGAPMIKVEASKYTEVGYVGRDVESMIRDLVELSVNMVKAQHTSTVHEKAARLAEERILDLLLPPPSSPTGIYSEDREARLSEARLTEASLHEGLPGEPPDSSREKLRQQLRDGKLNDRFVEFEVKDKAMPPIGIISNVGMEEVEMNLREMLGNMMPGKKKKRRVKVAEALACLHQEEAQKLIDMDEVARDAVSLAENAGIVFIDEIDKIASREKGHGPDISREGVQRDLLPIIEGSTVNTKYGMVKTDHILFIAAGAFHTSKPSDLIPELQGRFPIRVELTALGKEEFVRILTEPQSSLTRQYVGLLGTEGMDVAFTQDGIEEIAATAVSVNEKTENIGARRLFTIMERLLEKVSFEAPDISEKKLVVNGAYVRERMHDFVKDEDLSRFIL